MSTRLIELTQVGPGQFQSRFQAAVSGSYIVNLRYRKLAETKTHLMQTPVTVPFAPEFRDLVDNAALLSEVTAITGGHILSSDPTQTKIFDYSGLKFPETELPMTRLLLLIWLVVFLLDVAVRRIALDIRAVARRVASFGRRPLAERKADKNLERLRLTQKKLREQLSPSDEALASRRYKADEALSGDLPKAQVPLQSNVITEKPPEKPEPIKKETSEEQTHIQQLLRAKRKATEKRKGTMENNE
jgi:hypothetical protein